MQNKKWITVILGCALAALMSGCCLQHDWQEATCVTPKTCSKCGEIDGTVLDHTEGTWEIDGKANYVTSLVTLKKKCTVCGTVLETDMKSVCLHQDGVFLFNPSEYAERLGLMYGALDYDYETELLVLDDNTMACIVHKDGEPTAMISFNDHDAEMTGNEKESAQIESMMAYFYTDDMEEMVPMILGIILSCDESLDGTEVKEIAKQSMLYALSGEAYRYNDISYVLDILSDSGCFVISLR